MFVVALNRTVLCRISIENRCPDAGKIRVRRWSGMSKALVGDEQGVKKGEPHCERFTLTRVFRVRKSERRGLTQTVAAVAAAVVVIAATTVVAAAVAAVAVVVVSIVGCAVNSCLDFSY